MEVKQGEWLKPPIHCCRCEGRKKLATGIRTTLTQGGVCPLVGLAVTGTVYLVGRPTWWDPELLTLQGPTSAAPV